MKPIFTAVFSIILEMSFAGSIYVAPLGNDATGTGSVGNPYATLVKAAAISAPGDIIHISDGVYTFSSGVSIPAGVSIEGSGPGKVKLLGNYMNRSQSDALLMLISTKDGTNGKQHISGITLDGNNLTSYQGVVVYCRSHVKIYNCSIKNFVNGGLLFRGNYGHKKASVAATGNEIYNCKIENCGDRTTGLVGGGIVADGYADMIIHDNISRSGGRPANHNGNNFSAAGTNMAAGLKIYNNKFYRPSTDGTKDNSFILEMWDSQGGMEIYNNEFHGGTQAIDLGGNDDKSKGAYTYGYWIHDNLFDAGTQFADLPVPLVVAIDYEGSGENVMIERNHFRNYAYGIMITLGNVSERGIRNTTIRNNLFENIGSRRIQFSADIFVNGGGCPDTYGKISHLDIFNNTHSSNSLAALMIIGFKRTDTLIGLKYINNIVTNIRSHGYVTIDGNAGYMDSFIIRNNISFNNARGNEISFENGASPPVHYRYFAPIKKEPKLSKDFRLKTDSPAIDAGFDVGLPYRGSAPDIGAFETGAVRLKKAKL